MRVYLTKATIDNAKEAMAISPDGFIGEGWVWNCYSASQLGTHSMPTKRNNSMASKIINGLTYRRRRVDPRDATIDTPVATTATMSAKVI